MSNRLINIVAGAAALALTVTASHAAIINVDIHAPSAAEINDDAALANATIIDLLVDSEGDLLLSYEINLSTTGTIYNHFLEESNDEAPNAGAILTFPALGADSHVAFGTPLGGDLSSPSGSFPLSVGGPLAPVAHNGLVTRITVLNDAAATIDGFISISTDGVTSTIIDFETLNLPGDLNSDGFVGIDDLNLVLSNWNLNVPPANPLADPSGDNFVGIDDLNEVLANWNTGTPPAAGAAVPEPATMGLLALGGLMALKRRA
tara:strand:+ start:52 stop:837 length:786 start_codon:yes stop_codon:yes gene_type:complete